MSIYCGFMGYAGHSVLKQHIMFKGEPEHPHYRTVRINSRGEMIDQSLEWYLSNGIPMYYRVLGRGLWPHWAAYHEKRNKPKKACFKSKRLRGTIRRRVFSGIEIDRFVICYQTSPRHHHFQLSMTVGLD
jgi:hypothetical protein